MSNRRQFDSDIGAEVFDDELFYSLPRSTRKAISEKAPDDVPLARPGGPVRIGAVEDSLRDAGSPALALRVLEAAQARRLRRESAFPRLEPASADVQLELDPPAETSADEESAAVLREIAGRQRRLTT